MTTLDRIRARARGAPADEAVVVAFPDSLERLELLMALEETESVAIDEADLTEATTLADLARMIDAKRAKA